MKSNEKYILFLIKISVVHLHRYLKLEIHVNQRIVNNVIFGIKK